MIRLALIEDSAAYARALRTYLERVVDVELVFVGNSVTRNLSQLEAAEPDVVILDIDLGEESGIEGLPRLREVLPEAGVLMLTVFEDSERIFQSLRAGARGYLLKKESPERIVEAIRDVYRGDGAINGQVTNTILDFISRAPQPAASLDDYGLTKRERELAELLLQGLSYKEIAARTFISVDTLNSHVRKIYGKLGVHSRSEMTAKVQPR